MWKNIFLILLFIGIIASIFESAFVKFEIWAIILVSIIFILLIGYIIYLIQEYLKKKEKLSKEDTYEKNKSDNINFNNKPLNKQDERKKINSSRKLDREQMELRRKQSSIESINVLLKEFKQLQNNERFTKIIDNFLEGSPLENIELLAIPTKTTNAGYVNPKYLIEDLVDCKDNIDDIKYTLLSAFYQWKENKYSIASMLYRDSKKRLILIKNYKSLCSKYGFIETDSAESIVEALYEKKIFENDIKEFIALKLYKENQFKIYSSCIELANKLIFSQLKKIQSRDYIKRLENGEKIAKITLQEIDLMSGLEFEKFISKFFTDLGYDTEITKASGDQGIDILAKREGFLVAIQAKCYNGMVGNHAIMEAVAGMKYYNANKCMVVTNSTFTKSAIELAKANNVELWDRSVLQEKLNSL